MNTLKYFIKILKREEIYPWIEQKVQNASWLNFQRKISVLIVAPLAISLLIHTIGVAFLL